MHEHDGYAPHSHEVRADHGGVATVPRPCPAGETGPRHQAVTVTFYPCDAVSILRALREVADHETLRIVAQAELTLKD